MYVLPKLQDLTTWASNVHEMWEISAPPNKSLYWSLVLSFIITSPENSDCLAQLLGSPEEIKELMQKKKITCQNLISKNIKRQVNNFNPFKNQYYFYYNKDLSTVIRLFSLRLNRKADEMKKYSGEWGDDIKLKAAAKMLKICIRVFEMDSVGNKTTSTINAPENDQDNMAVIFLFKHSGSTLTHKTKAPPEQDRDRRVINIFGFGMDLNHVVHLRREALGHILKSTDLSQHIIEKIQRDFTGNGNFLVSLLSKEFKMESVSSIYASPYITWKLSAAGFVIDPCIRDGNGLSAFYHCMGLGSTHILQVLYDYASNSFEHSDKTRRNLDTEILKAFDKIRRALQNDYSTSQAFSTLGEKNNIALKSYQEMLCFNEYQRHVVEKIADQQGGLSPLVGLPDEDANKRKRKCIITSLLSTYPSYFNFPKINKEKSSVVDENEFSKFQNFLHYSEYHENLDNYTCLLFFDNFLFLDLPVDVMNSAVKNLFLTVFSYTLFPKCKHGVHCNKHVLTAKDCPLRVIPFIFRTNFLDSAKDVLQELKRPLSYCSNESHDPNSVLEQVRLSLKDLPDIKGEFLMGRLWNYLAIAAKVPLSSEDVKGVLTIERVLQVIGETLNTHEPDSVIGHLLCSCLGGVVEEFTLIRNKCLSNYKKPRLVGGKLSLENKITLFKKIQDTIKEMQPLVEPVYVSQQSRIVNYMVERGLKGAEAMDSTLSLNMKKERDASNRILLDKYTENKSGYKYLTNNLLNYIEGEARNEACSNFRKIGQISALNFLFTFLANDCDEKNKKKILSSLNKAGILSKANAAKNNDIDISTSESNEIIEIVSDLRKISKVIFLGVGDEPFENIDPSTLKTFISDAQKFSWFTSEEMSKLKEKISQLQKMSREAKKPLNDFLLKRGLLSEPEARQLVDQIFASQEVKTCISTNLSCDLQKASECLRSVKKNDKDVFQKANDMEDDLDCLIRFTKTKEGAHSLLTLEFPEELRKKVLRFLNRKVVFLLDRIGHLKSILIDEDEEIPRLWNWGKSEQIKTQTRFLMCQRYRQEKNVSSSLEMLLFDCMNILITRKSLSKLWTKATDLFSGASLRNILSHGSPILEIVGGFLDEDDVPSHFIDKMLELIEDGDALKILSDLWENEKIINLEQFENMLEADDPDLREVKKWKEKRSGSEGGWKDYLTLLPLM